MAFLKKDIRKEFLPSAQEIVETPESPLGKFTIRIVALLILTVILWSVLGEVDEVAIGSARLIPDGNIKSLESSESGIVKELLVKEGDFVDENDVLVIMDSSLLLEEKIKFEEMLEANLFERQIMEFMIDGDEEALEKSLKSNNLIVSDNRILNLYKEYKKIQEEAYDSQISYYSLSAEKLSNEKEQLDIDLLKEKKLLEKLSRELENLKELFESGSVSQKEFDDKKVEFEIQSKDVDKMNGKIIALKTQMDIGINEESRYNLSFSGKLLKDSLEIDKKIREYTREIIKLENRLSKKILRSPVSGSIQRINVYTRGEMIEAGKSILVIVPKDAQLVVEAQIKNQDIGYVKEKQTVDIKIDAYPFQKYGELEGHIDKISPDANFIENQGFLYKAIIIIDNNEFKRFKESALLQSGMTATIEVKTGKRKIIEFFLPGIDILKESFQIR